MGENLGFSINLFHNLTIAARFFTVSWEDRKILTIRHSPITFEFFPILPSTIIPVNQTND
jgi:hypothetical protein